MTIDELYQFGVQTQKEHLGDAVYICEDLNSGEYEFDHLVNAFHWGAIYSRPNLDAKSRAICSLSAMTVLGRYDRQMRRRIEGALSIGLTPPEIMEVFMQVMLYGGAITARTASRISQSVFTDQGIAYQVPVHLNICTEGNIG